MKMAGVLLLALLLSIMAIKAQPMPPPNPNLELNSWSFDDTNFLSDLGYAPISMENLGNPASFDGNALQVDSTNAAWLQYNIAESDGTLELRFVEGAIELWVSADWTSGSGPGEFGRLIDVGAYGTNAPSSWWSLYFTPDGSRINFSSETNGVFTNYLSAPIAWGSNAWHFIALTYNPVSSELYIDGQLATNGAGVFYRPSAEVVSNGFFVGSDSTGLAQSRVCIDDLVTYSYSLSEYEVTNDYAAGLQLMGGGFHHEGSGLVPPGGTPWTNSLNPSPDFQIFTTNELWLQMVSATNSMTTNGTGYLVIHEPWNVTNSVYDLFSTTNLAPSFWQWVLRSAPGQTNLTATGLAGPNGYFILGTTELANDGSGLTVAYENLVGTTYSSDGHGTPNAWYVQNNINPLISGVGTQDPDLDGLLNYQEYLYGSKPTIPEGTAIWVGTPNGTTGIP